MAFKIDTKYLHPLEEIVIDPEEALRLGVTPFTAHNLRMPDGTPILEYIYKIHMKIWNLKATAQGTTVLLTWDGETNVDIIIDGDESIETHPNGVNRHTVTLPRGRHTFKLTEWSTLFPLYAEVYVEGTVDERYTQCSVSVKDVGKHSFNIVNSQCGNLWVEIAGANAVALKSPHPVTGLDPDTDYILVFKNKQGEIVRTLTVRTDGMSSAEKALLNGLPPKILTLGNIAVDDTMSIGDLVGTFTYSDGGLPITFVGLLGAMSKYLTATVDGNIYISDMPTAPVAGSWTVVLEVANAKGADTASLGLVFSSDTPSFTDNFMIDISETTPIGTVLGTIAIDDKGQPPITITLPAELEYYLAIDVAGVITLEQIADFEALPATFTALGASKKAMDNSTITVTNAIASKTGSISMRVQDDIADNPPIWDAATPAIYSLNENLPAGTNIVNLNNYLNPDGTTFVLSDNANFQVVGGVLQSKVPFDYENIQSYTLTVTPDNAGRVGVAKTFIVKVLDVADIPPSYTVATATPSVAEMSAIGTVVGTYPADAGSAPITYTVSDNVNFAVDATGKVTTKTVFDFEATNSYTVVVTATNTISSATKTLTVSVTDIATDKPVFASGTYTFSIAENNAVGANIGSVSATGTDPSAITYTISDTTRFSINSGTGQITANAVYDYETTSSYGATVTATNSAGSSTSSVTVNITDVADLPPKYNNATNADTFYENNLVPMTVADATADSGTAPITYTLSGADASKFVLNTGMLDINEKMDFETKNTYTVTVTATNAYGSDTQTHTFTVANAAEKPIWASATDTASFQENNTVGSTVGTYTASKPAGNSSNITYSLGNATAVLAIDSVTGVLTTKKSFDYETDATSFVVGIDATNSEGTSTLSLTVNITDMAVEIVPPTVGDIALDFILDAQATDEVAYILPIADTGGAAVTLFELDDSIPSTQYSTSYAAKIVHLTTAYNVRMKDANAPTGTLTIFNGITLDSDRYYGGVNTLAYPAGLAAKQQDVLGGMNDHYHIKIRARAKNSAGWGAWKDLVVRVWNKPIKDLAAADGKMPVETIAHLIRQGEDITMLNLKGVTDLSNLSYYIAKDGWYGDTQDWSARDNFNGDLSRWNTKDVTNLNSAFYHTSFSDPIGIWNTSNVTTMISTFQSTPFGYPLNGWDVSKVTSMMSMFQDTQWFDRPLDGWDTSSVTEMSRMFASAQKFNHPLESFNMSNVTTIQGMFDGAVVFDQPLALWDTSNVTNMADVFKGAVVFNQPLPWNTSSVTNFNSMFDTNQAFNQPLPWDTSSATDMYQAFFNSLVFNQDLNAWDVTNVTNWGGFYTGSALVSTNVPLKLR